MNAKTLLCFGYGYTANAFAALLSAQNVSIIRTHRTLDSALKMRADAKGFKQYPSEDFQLPDQCDLLISIPPDDQGCPVFRDFAEQLPAGLWVGYLSSTGVYGDLNGGWAFETTPVAPLSIEAKRRAKAEEQWLSKGAHVFRLPGIYGPGRSAIDRIRAGHARSIIKPGQVFSRAHVDDIASLLKASWEKPHDGRIYNVSDDKPTPPEVPLQYAAMLLNQPAPPAIRIEEAGLSEKAQRFYAECKRVSNSRAKSELGWLPKYPTFKEGLDAIFAHQFDRTHPEQS